LQHPSYDAFWRDQALDQILAAQPLKVPVMLVHSHWDQEDIYGAPAVYKAIKPKDTNNDKVFLVMGPWHHGQEIGDGSTLGALKLDNDTGLYFRQNILRPFLDHYLKDEAPNADVPPVSAFETGTNVWRKLPAWPAGCASGCSIKPTPLYLEAGLKLSHAAPKPSDAAFDEYISDPAKPVPFRARPIQPVGYGEDRKSTRLNSSHGSISYAVFCLKKKKIKQKQKRLDGLTLLGQILLAQALTANREAFSTKQLKRQGVLNASDAIHIRHPACKHAH